MRNNYPVFECTPEQPMKDARLGGLSKDQQAAAKVWANWWIENAFRTTPMTASEFAQLPEYVGRLYESANLGRPHVLLCQSPLGCLRWMQRIGADPKNWHGTYQGGNMCSAYDSYLTYFRRVLRLELKEHEHYDAWEWLAVHGGGFRMMLPKHCLISDYPMHIDRELHNENGPTHLWSDGFAIWHIHSVRVDEQIVMRPETQTVSDILNEENEEVRRVRIERFGWGRFIRESEAEKTDHRHNERDTQDEELYRMQDGTHRFRCVDPSTGREYFLGVPRDITSCEGAASWMSHGLDKRAIHRS